MSGSFTGLGNGAANIGARFTAEAATALRVAVSFSAVLAAGVTSEQATAESSAAITQYFKELALDTPDGEPVVARISSVGALLYALPSIIDYSDLAFNGGGNIALEDVQVAVLGGVTINATLR